MKKNDWLDIFLLALITLLGGYLRLVSLEANPGWYTDEGTHLEIAKQLLNGRVQYFAVQDSMLLFSRLPLFGWLFAGVGSVFGVNMLVLRSTTAVLGALSILLLHRAVLISFATRGLALTAAFCLAIYPEAILYSRFGFSYNLLTPLLLIAICGVSAAYQQAESANLQKRCAPLAVAAVAIGFGTITDLAMISTAVWFVLAVIWLDPRQLWWCVPLLGLPLCGYVVWMWASTGDAFWVDLAFVRSRLGGRTIWAQGWLLAENYAKLLFQQSWIALGFVGLWLLPARPAKWLVLSALVLPVIMLGRTAPLVELSFYYILWLLPLIALGVASLAWFGWQEIAKQIPNRWIGTAVAAVVVGLPLCMSLFFTHQRVTQSFGTVIDPFLVDGVDAIAVAEFIELNSEPSDLVIASPAVGWQLSTETADFQMAIAANGEETPHLPSDLQADRYTFDPRFSRARYVIVDNIWRNWAVFHIPTLPDHLATIETWPVRYRSGNITVYENPAAIR